MIQPLTGVNYPHFALLKREFLISKYCFFFYFFPLPLLCVDYLTYVLAEGKVTSDIIQMGTIWTENPQAIKAGTFVVCCRPMDNRQVFPLVLPDLVSCCPPCGGISMVLFFSVTQELVFQPEY